MRDLAVLSGPPDKDRRPAERIFAAEGRLSRHQSHPKTVLLVHGSLSESVWRDHFEAFAPIAGGYGSGAVGASHRGPLATGTPRAVADVRARLGGLSVVPGGHGFLAFEDRPCSERVSPKWPPADAVRPPFG
jgi:hypothetical protein